MRRNCYFWFYYTPFICSWLSKHYFRSNAGREKQNLRKTNYWGQLTELVLHPQSRWWTAARNRARLHKISPGQKIRHKNSPRFLLSEIMLLCSCGEVIKRYFFFTNSFFYLFEIGTLHSRLLIAQFPQLTRDLYFLNMALQQTWQQALWAVSRKIYFDKLARNNFYPAWGNIDFQHALHITSSFLRGKVDRDAAHLHLP